MLITPVIAIVAATSTASVPGTCRVYDVEEFTGSAELPDGQIFVRVSRTVIHHRIYGLFSRLEEGTLWVRPAGGNSRSQAAIKISYNFQWDDTSQNSTVGPRRGDLFIVKVQKGTLVANAVSCPQRNRQLGADGRL